MRVDNERRGEKGKPREQRYWQASRDIEDIIADALPDVVNKLIEMAKGGHLGAAKYLCDRILGRCAAIAKPPAVDDRRPKNQDADDQWEWEWKSRSRTSPSTQPPSDTSNGHAVNSQSSQYAR